MMPVTKKIIFYGKLYKRENVLAVKLGLIGSKLWQNNLNVSLTFNFDISQVIDWDFPKLEINLEAFYHESDWNIKGKYFIFKFLLKVNVMSWEVVINNYKWNFGNGNCVNRRANGICYIWCV